MIKIHNQKTTPAQVAKNVIRNYVRKIKSDWLIDYLIDGLDISRMTNKEFENIKDSLDKRVDKILGKLY